MAQDALRYRVVVIGGSAGSLDVIMKMVPELPSDAGVTYLVVTHRKNQADSILAEILERKTKMEVREVEDKDPILPNMIYTAPADYHLLIEDESTFSLDSSEKVQYSRPSIDVTCESVADVFGRHVIGVLLSGANADGAAGLRAIKRSGGCTIVEDPKTASVAYMPQKAIDEMDVDKILPADAIASALRKLIRGR